MSNFSTFFPAGGGGGEGAGINSYAPFKVSADTNNPQGYNATTGLYTNPVDESVWLKTGQIIQDTVTPNPYPNAFKNPVIDYNNKIASVDPLTVNFSSAVLGATADYRTGYKHIYYMAKQVPVTTGVPNQKVYKLDSNGVPLATITPAQSTLESTNDLSYWQVYGMGFNAAGNSGAGSIWIVCRGGMTGNYTAVQYSLDFQTILTQQLMVYNPGGNPYYDLRGFTYCEFTNLIYFVRKYGSSSQLSAAYTFNPVTNAYLGPYTLQTGSGGVARTSAAAICTNPLTGQVAISNFPTSTGIYRYTRLFVAPSGSPTQLNAVSPEVTVANDSPFSASSAMFFLDPPAANTLIGLNQMRWIVTIGWAILLSSF